MAKKINNPADSTKSWLPRFRKSAWINDNQHDQPDTEIVGLIAVSQEAKRNVGGFLHTEANNWPSSHLKDDRFITEKDGSVNPEIQSQLAWLGAQILGMANLEITGTEEVGLAFNLAVSHPSPGQFLITLTYPEPIPGPPGATGATGATGGTGATGADGTPKYIRENLTTGLEIDTNPAFTTAALIHAYYRADALRPATSFYGKAAGASLHLHNASDVLKLQLGIVSAQNELDTRESPFVIRYGVTPTNARVVQLNSDGTGSIGNSTLPSVRGQFMVIMASSAQKGIHIEGRTGMQEAAIYIAHLNQADVSFLGKPIDIRGAVTPHNWGILFHVDKYGDILYSNSETINFLTTDSAGVKKTGYDRKLTASPSLAASHSSKIVERLYKDSAAVVTTTQGFVGSNPAIGFLGHVEQDRINVGSIDCEGHFGAFAALDALKNFGFIDGTLTLGTAPEPPEVVAELLSRCQVAQMLPLWIYNHVFSGAFIEAIYLDTLYDVGARTDAIKKSIDVFVQSPINLLGWVDGSNTAFFGETEAENLISLLAMRDYITSESVQTTFYCALDEFGRIDSVGYLGLLALLNADVDFEDPATNFYNFMRAFNAESIAVWTAQGSYSEHVDLAADCTGYDCTNWTQYMDFTADNWADSTDLSVGNYNAVKGYWCDDLGVLRLEIPYHIIYAAFEVCGSEEGLIPSEIRVQNLDTSVWTGIDAFIDCKTYEWEGDAPDGIAIEITAPAGAALESQLRNLFLAGLGVQPMPD